MKISETTATKQAAMVELCGPPIERGKLWGTINAHSITHDLETHYLKLAETESIDQNTLLKRSEKFTEIVEKLAPHWLDEARGVAQAVGIDQELYISFIANGYRNLFLHPECTSYTVHRDYTQNNRILFHKTRDNLEKDQCAFIMDRSQAQLNKFIAVSDASVITSMMMVNEKGLAGSADTGGLKVEKPRYQGLMNTYILRFIAEKANNCQEALAIVEEFIAKKIYAGGDKTGTHWLFVDKTGTVLEISHNSETIRHTFHDQKVYFSIREDSAAAKKLEDSKQPIDFHTFHNVSRDESICLPSSISGMTVEIDDKNPDTMTCAWISLPAKTISVPLFIGQRKTALPLFTGELYQHGKSKTCDNEIWESREKIIYQDKLSLEKTAHKLLQNGQRKEFSNLLDSWSQQQIKATLVLLQSVA